MKKLSLNALKERVLLMKRTSFQTEEGDYQEKSDEMFQAWAAIKPFFYMNKNAKETPDTIGLRKVLGAYRIAMHKNTIRDALHAGLNALIWKGKILDIFAPFQECSCEPFMEAVFLEYERKN